VTSRRVGMAGKVGRVKKEKRECFLVPSKDPPEGRVDIRTNLPLVAQRREGYKIIWRTSEGRREVTTSLSNRGLTAQEQGRATKEKSKYLIKGGARGEMPGTVDRTTSKRKAIMGLSSLIKSSKTKGVPEIRTKGKRKIRNLSRSSLPAHQKKMQSLLESA